MYNVRKEEKITVLTIGWALLTKCENLVVPIRKEEGKILLQKKKNLHQQDNKHKETNLEPVLPKLLAKCQKIAAINQLSSLFSA